MLPKVHKPLHVASVAVHKDGKYLWLKRRWSGKLCFPGGKLSPGEHSASGAIRELHEETGLNVSPENIKYLGSKQVPNRPNITVHSFLATNPEGEVDLTKDPDGEGISHHWLAELPHHSLLHVPPDNDVTLQFLGLHKPEPVNKSEKKEWRAKDGLKIPHFTNPNRKKWDSAYQEKLVEVFGGGNPQSLQKIVLPVSEDLSSHIVGPARQGGRDRREFYSRMVAGGDSLPPVVAKKNGNGWTIVDGNARLHAAIKNKLPEIEGFAIAEEPVKKSDDSEDELLKQSRIRAIAASSRGSAWRSSEGNWIVVGQDPHNRDQWRATVLDENKEHKYHLVAPTHEGALGLLPSLNVDLSSNPVKLHKDENVWEFEPLQKDEQPNNLVVVHNLTSKNLLHAHRVGGLVAPSIAVAHKDHPLDSFGEISLVGDHKLIDPEKGVPLYDADVYSPRYPRMENKINRKALDKFYAKHKDSIQRSGSAFSDYDNIEDKFKEGGAENVHQHHYIKTGLGLSFLEKVKGMKIESKTKPVSIPHSYVDTPAMHEFMSKHGMGMRYPDNDPEYFQELSQVIPIAAQQKYEKDFGEATTPEEAVETYVPRGIVGRNSDGLFRMGSNDVILANYKKIGQTELDRYGMEDTIKEALKPHEEEYKAWAEKEMAPIHAGQTMITRKGTRKASTLENILAEMTRSVKGGEGFNYGLGSTRAQGAAKISSIDELKNRRYQIVPKEEFAKHKKDFEDRFAALHEEIRRYHHEPDGFRTVDGLHEAIAESYKRGKRLSTELGKAGFNRVPPAVVDRVRKFADDLRAMPTEYFEAKPQRIVGLGEFKGAAVPHDADPSVFDALKQAGVAHIERFDRNAEGERKAAIQRIGQAQGLFLAELSLHKATKPEDFGSILKASSPEGKNLVDHTPDLSAHPHTVSQSNQAYRNEIVEGPKTYVKKSLGGGITRKLAFVVDPKKQTSEPRLPETQKFMVKPYHEKIVPRCKPWQKYHIQGWAEMTNQAMYHAAGIGHLHQKVSVAEHNMRANATRTKPEQSAEKEPALVIHMDKDFKPAMEAYAKTPEEQAKFEALYPGDKTYEYAPNSTDDIRKITVMDFLSNNLDRHNGNLMLHPDGRVLTVDHSRSFQYVNNRKSRTGRYNLGTDVNSDDFNNYISAPLDQRGAALGKYQPSPVGGFEAREEVQKGYAPVLNEWWPQNRDNVVGVLESRLRQIKDPEVAAHIRRNFMERVRWLDDIGENGIENFGDDWHTYQIPMHKAGKITPNGRES